MQRMRFAPAGVPLSCAKRSTLAGVRCTADLGLDAMEMEFVRGVRMKPAQAREIGELARKLDIVLTAHAPYFINLLSRDPEKVEASRRRIIETAIVTHAANGYSIVFHAAYYGNYSKEEAFRLVAERVEDIVEELKARGIKLWIRPETTGKPKQWGSVDEVIALAQEVDMVLPCIDFAHLHARTGRYNSEEEFRGVMEKLEQNLGKFAIENMHIHISGINYNEKGERNHLNLEESDLNWKDLLRVLKEYNAKGVIVSESPNIEGDALLMKKYWEEI